MRALRVLCCAVALAALFAPGVRGDEYTKQTFLTFSGPVQLPGITLAAGTYQFRLADPDSGRQLLQVWDKDGSKLYTTLMTIPDQRMKPSEKPVVMFSESPSGQAQPIRAWFYPNDTYGQEFVYPKDQAMKIATASHTSVLAYEGEAKDEAAYKSAKVGRVDDSGRIADAESASTTTARAETTTAPPATSTTSEANRDNMPSNRATGTTGSVTNSTSASRTGQAAAGANAAAPPTRTAENTARTLPRTASPMTTVQLLAALSLAAGIALRAYRTRKTTAAR